jgi:CDP-6-deoxy-D-xylo-4-hexulose-3-dehydrase
VVRVKSYALAADTFGPEEIVAAKSVLDSGRLTMGTRVAQFEREFAEYTGAKHALMVNSGSSANLLMVDALMRRSNAGPALLPGDEILVPALAWPTTVWPLVQLGLVPVLVDVDPDTMAIDLKSAQSALSEKTRGMFLIHVLGQAAQMEKYAHFCSEYGLVLLEDACESLGAFSGDKHVGNFGKMGSFSFYYSHHISTVEGGMIVTSDSALYDDLRSLRAHGWVRDRSDRDAWKYAYPEIDDRFMFIMPGYNVRPMEMQGAIGSVQLRKIDGMLNMRTRVAANVSLWLEKYTPWIELIGADRGLRVATAFGTSRVHSWMALPMRTRPGAPVGVEDVKRELQTSGVDTRPIIAGNLKHHPAMTTIRYRHADSLKVADSLLDRGFMIGCHPVWDTEAMDTLERAFARLGMKR